MDFINKYLLLENLLLISFFLSVLIILKFKKLRLLFSYILSISLSLFIVEKFIIKPQNSKIVLGDYSSGKYFSKDLKHIGYGPPSKGVFSSIKIDKSTGDTVYNVKYTISNSLRLTPNSNVESDSTMIFLGCSFTFGEGLNDNETFPYYVNEMFNNKYKIKNFGFHGYGPNHIHSLIKNVILVDESILKDMNKTEFYYKFYNFHIERAIPVNANSNAMPIYEVLNDSLIYKGVKGLNINKFQKFNAALKRRIWDRSSIRTIFVSEKKNQFKSEDTLRTLLLIKDMNEMIKNKGSKFNLIVDKESMDNKNFMDFINNNNIKTLCLECEVNDISIYKKNRIEYDGHPNSYWNILESRIFYNKFK